MSSPPDLRPLFGMASELELRAEVMRSRASRIGLAVAGMRWTSPGARACSARVHDICGSLLGAARMLDKTAWVLRSEAVRLAAGAR